MLSEDDHRKSRSELQLLISSVNKTKKPTGVKRTPRFRFKALVRSVMNNLKWLMGESTDGKVPTKYTQLTPPIKGLLRSPVEDRTAEEKDLLFKVLGGECLERYPENVQQGLTASAMFNYFPPGRVLVAEGHPSVAMYFIISGQANVSKMIFDAGVKQLKSVDIAVMNAGEGFGEINILHDEPWPTTVTTLTHIELITVRKENFQEILEEFLGEQKREITQCLSLFSYFKDWNHRTIVECCILGRVVKYKNDSLIVGENCGRSENSYFIVSGSCQVIHHLQVEHIPRKNFTELRIIERNAEAPDDAFPSSYTVKNVERPKRRRIADPIATGLIVDKLLQQMITDLPLPESRSNSGGETQMQSHFFKIANLVPGACFGIGESLENKFILSSSPSVTLLCIPKFFLKIHNMGNVWGRLRELFNCSYPSPQTIFSQFLMHKKWRRSRAKYLESLIKLDRPFTGLTTAEAPYYHRLTEQFENPIFRRIKKVQINRDGK